ncbi:MAG: hypothetical protein EA358_05950 [Flavobacteriales bacterium]|jgi:hypothetical protein|nr:MAG: hypothetical protein EA358_05950 [Flavobacteriales bacterium]
MRIADTIPHASMRIIIYALEKYHYVEFEAGPMKQGFRFSKEQVPGVDNIKKVISPQFITEVEERFLQMQKQALAALKNG